MPCIYRMKYNPGPEIYSQNALKSMFWFRINLNKLYKFSGKSSLIAMLCLTMHILQSSQRLCILFLLEARLPKYLLSTA